MQPLRTKRALIAVCQQEFETLDALLDGVSARTAQKRDAKGDTIRDIVAQQARRVDMYLGGQAGHPGGGRRGPGPDTVDRWVAADGAGWASTRRALTRAHERLMWCLAKTPDAALFGGALPDARSRWAEIAGAYRRTAEEIRSRLDLAVG